MDKIVRYISKYRQVLMGIAILGVMIGHCKSDWTPTLLSKFIGVLCYSVFTGGFLFLSGFGLYFSMKKNPSIKGFYAKRIKRLLLPWVCIAIPYFALMDLYVGASWKDFFWHISTLAFWKSGNYSGMWYISVILALYCIYPIYHKFVFIKHPKFSWSFLATIVTFSLVDYLVFDLNADYHRQLEVGRNFCIFFIGVYVANMSVNTSKSQIYNFLIGGVF